MRHFSFPPDSGHDLRQRNRFEHFEGHRVRGSGDRFTQAPINRDSPSERIRCAAIELFNARGYHGTPIRALARTVRVEAATLYYHFPSKQTILTEIFTRVIDDLLAGLERAMQSGTTVEDRLRAVVRFHVLFHAERQAEANISRSELRSLTPANLRRIIAKRDRYEGMLRSLP